MSRDVTSMQQQLFFGSCGTQTAYAKGWLRKNACCYPSGKGQQFIAELVFRSGLAPLSSRTAEPAIACSAATSNSIRSRELSAPTSSGGAWSRGPTETTWSLSATHSSDHPWTRAETTTTKKTALKIVFPLSTCEERTIVPS